MGARAADKPPWQLDVAGGGAGPPVHIPADLPLGCACPRLAQVPRPPLSVTAPARDSGLLLGSQRGRGETRPVGRPGWALSPEALSPPHKTTRLHHAARSQDLLWPTISGWLHRQKRDQAQAHLGSPHDSSLAFMSGHTPSVPPYTATPSNPQGSRRERGPRPVGQVLGSQVPECKPSRRVWPATRQQAPSLRAPDATRPPQHPRWPPTTTRQNSRVCTCTHM